MTPTFTLHRQVQFAETDLAGVMHFANYFRWMEEVEHAFFRSLGLSVVQPHDGAVVSWPRVTVACEYFAPLHFESHVEIRLFITDLREKSLTYEAEFHCNGRCTARGRTKAVCCEMRDHTFRSISVPPFIREKIEAARRGAAP